MSRLPLSIALVGSLALGACVAAPPAGPSVAVMPGSGKTFAQFQQDDATCRQYANQQTGGASPTQAANNSAVGSAVVGTGLGAAAGALIGAAAGNPGAGAAIGAGSGLLLGSAAGASNAQISGGNLQRGYDIGYVQCMAAQGNQVPPVQAVAAQPAYGYPAPYYAPGYYAPAYYGPAYYGPAYYGPEVSVGFGFGGGRWHH